MDYRESMRQVLDYIEENLTQEITTEQLAGIAGYSKYHFARIFAEMTGLTPADYIRKRRLCEIAEKLDGYGGSIASLAFAYGFNSKENFVRAFKAEHGVLPTEYRRANNSLRLYPKSTVEQRIAASAPFGGAAVGWEDMPKPDFVKLSPFSLTVFLSDEDFPPRFWNKYNCGGFSKRLSGGRTVADYGVSDWQCVGNVLRYYIGIRTEDALGDTTGTTTLPIAGGTYAVFTTKPSGHTAFVDTIQRTWEYINMVWLPGSGYERTGGYEFETYVEESRTYSQEIYIPVRHAEDISQRCMRKDGKV